MNNKLKIAVSCLSFVMCLFVVISVCSPLKASAYSDTRPYMFQTIYQPLFPFSTFDAVLDDIDSLYIDAIPTQFYSKKDYDDEQGVDNFYNVGDMLYNDINIQREIISLSNPIINHYKNATWSFRFYPDYVAVSRPILRSEYFFITKSMNEVGYFIIDNQSPYNIYFDVGGSSKVFVRSLNEYVIVNFTDEFQIDSMTQFDIYAFVKERLIDTYSQYNVDIAYFDFFYIQFDIPGLTTAEVGIVDLNFSYPVFSGEDLFAYVKDIQSSVVEPVIVYQLNWVEQIANDIHDFFSIEILPDISFYDILLLTVAIPILIAILKVWLGG